MRLRLPGLGRLLHRPAELSHSRSLENARNLGFAPRVVYDIGAYRGDWSRSTARIFPGARFTLFEANANNESDLKASGFPYFLAALDAVDGAEKQLFLSRQEAATGVSLYRETTPFYSDDNAYVVDVKTRTLDAVAREHRLDPPDFIKIDVQGAEIDVLAGAKESLANCQMLLLEASLLSYNKGAPLIGEVFEAVSRLGFKCVDICEIHRTGPGLTFQADLIFVRDDLYHRYRSVAGLL
jgi:FkbM family methyltransferase